MRLTKIVDIRGEIEVLTGLRVGGGDMEMRIGGIDNAIIRGARDNNPYIPGSSLKGKIRSLLEWRSGAVQNGPLSKRDLDSAQMAVKARIEPILKLFGVSGDADGDGNALGPTRLGFHDARLIEDELGSNLPYTEVKSENMINRIKGVAEHPRQTERVAAGVRFSFRVSVKIIDDEQDLIGTLLEGMRLVEMDGLGGSVSRGYGKVRFNRLTQDGVSIQETFDAIDPFMIAA